MLMRYEVTTHCTDEIGTAKSWESFGSATFTIWVSITLMNIDAAYTIATARW